MKKHKKKRNYVRNHVAEEKNELAYKIEESPVLGRYLVASKEIQPGDVILKDEPLVIGPCQESKPICLGCYENLYTDHKCIECNIPLCSQTCPGFHQKHGHSLEECKLLSKTKPIITSYYAITPLRCLVLKTSDPEKWRIIENMESHDTIRKNLKIWETNQQLAVDVIRNSWGLEEFSGDEIHKVCGVLEVNAFEIASSGSKCLRAIYPNAFLFAHDCTPNTSHSDDKDYNLTVRAIRSIPVNGNITVNYTYILQSTLKRRKHLLCTKFFSCCCKRCKDPTEFNTYAGAVLCQKCRIGKMLPVNPLDDSADWKCDSGKCGCKCGVSTIEPFLDRIFKELDGIGGNDLIGYETFLEKYKNILYENNYLCLSALHSLSQLYGKIEGYLINDLSEEQLDRKIEICRKLIRVFDKLEPGLSKQRGLLLYELQAPLMVLIRRRMERNSITKKELKVKIKEVCRYLEDAVLILSKEPEDSAEASIAKAADEALSHLRNSV